MVLYGVCVCKERVCVWIEMYTSCFIYYLTTFLV